MIHLQHEIVGDEGLTLGEAMIFLVLVTTAISAKITFDLAQDNVEMASIISQMTAYKQSIETFKTKYGYYPGNLPESASPWPGKTCAPNNLSLYGSGDGALKNSITVVATNENGQSNNRLKHVEAFTAWCHMKLANLGSYDNISTPVFINPAQLSMIQKANSEDIQYPQKQSIDNSESSDVQHDAQSEKRKIIKQNPELEDLSQHQRNNLCIMLEPKPFIQRGTYEKKHPKNEYSSNTYANIETNNLAASKLESTENNNQNSANFKSFQIPQLSAVQSAIWNLSIDNIKNGNRARKVFGTNERGILRAGVNVPKANSSISGLSEFDKGLNLVPNFVSGKVGVVLGVPFLKNQSVEVRSAIDPQLVKKIMRKVSISKSSSLFKYYGNCDAPTANIFCSIGVQLS